MADTNAREMQVKEKQEVNKPEQTRPEPIFTPPVDIFETEKEITLLADLPGVTSENLSIDLNDRVLTLTGNIEPFENADEEDLVIEQQFTVNYKSPKIKGSDLCLSQCSCLPFLVKQQFDLR